MCLHRLDERLLKIDHQCWWSPLTNGVDVSENLQNFPIAVSILQERVVCRHFKGSVQQKLRDMLLYIIQKLFTERIRQTLKIFFVKGPVHNLHKTPSAVLSQPNYFYMQM